LLQCFSWMRSCKASSACLRSSKMPIHIQQSLTSLIKAAKLPLNISRTVLMCQLPTLGSYCNATISNTSILTLIFGSLIFPCTLSWTFLNNVPLRQDAEMFFLQEKCQNGFPMD
jgi:hypothetical protein